MIIHGDYERRVWDGPWCGAKQEGGYKKGEEKSHTIVFSKIVFRQLIALKSN